MGMLRILFLPKLAGSNSRYECLRDPAYFGIARHRQSPYAEVADDAKDAVAEGAQTVQEKAEDLAEASQEMAEEAVSSSSQAANSNQA